jgi:hypothetical protein
MTLVTPISRNVSWSELLPALGTPVSTTALPATVRCPLCQAERMTVYPDQALYGQWLHCAGCNFSGDTVEVASRAWGLDIPATLLRLAYQGVSLPPEALVPNKVQTYHEEHIGYRARINDFWRDCRERLAKHDTAEMAALVRTVAGVRPYEHAAWREWGGRYLGACNRVDAEGCLQPGSTDYRAHGHHRGHGAGGRRIFVGGGWRDVLVVPFFDLPGRITGILFVGREGNPAKGDFVFKPTQFAGRSGRFREAGLQMIDARLGPPHPHLGDTVFVVPSAVMALMLQLRWMRANAIPLPIVGTFSDGVVATRSVWDRLPARPLVFFAPEVGDEVLVQAKYADAMVSRLAVSKRELQRDMNHRDPLAWLQAAKRAAVPWRTALRDRLRRLPLEAAEVLLLQMEFDWSELEEFVMGSPADLRDRLGPFLDGRLVPPRVKVSGRVVVEKDDCWRLEPSGELVSNATIRLERILHTKRGDTFCRGIVRFRGEVVPFTERMDVISRGLLPWARNFLLRSRKGLMNFQPTWSRKALSVALQLHQPEVNEAADSVGYHEDCRRFFFPKFSMALNGEALETALPIASGERLPAADLEPPTPLVLSEIDALSADSSEVSVVWAMAACIVDALVAKFARRRPAGIALVGQGAQIMGRLAAILLGCIEERLPSRQRTEVVLDRLRGVCQQHDWPVVLATATGQLPPSLKAWCASPETKNCIAPLDWDTATVAAMGGDWHIVRCDGVSGMLRTLNAAAAKIIPAYFQDLAKRHFIYEITKPCWIMGLIEDMADWFDRSGGDGQAVRRIKTVLTGSGRYPAWHLFLDLIAKLIEEGTLGVYSRPLGAIRGDLPPLLCYNEPESTRGSLHISQRSFNEVLTVKGIPAVDAPLITRTLREAGVLLEEADDAAGPAWVLPWDWSDEQLRRRYKRGRVGPKVPEISGHSPDRRLEPFQPRLAATGHAVS